MELCVLVAIGGAFFSVTAKMTKAELEKKKAAIETLRKGDISFTIMDGTAPVAGQDITIEQIRNHFGFGAAMAYWPLDSASISDKFGEEFTGHAQLTENYKNAFAKYCQWITPENCMKWPDDQYIEGADNYENGDIMIDWALAHDINVRGHNLFWNQSLQWVPEWMDSIAQTKDYVKGQQAVDDRIQGAMTHYKGRCAHWDIINEIIHGQVEIEPGNPIGTLKALTGREDADIFKYVLDEAAKIDSDAKFCINDYNLLSQWSDKDQYIPAVKNLVNQGCKVDIIGCEGHFGDYVEMSDFEPKLNDMAANFPDQQIWMTEVDWEVPAAQCPQKLQELLTTCFAHEHVGGFLVWTPWEGNLWREGYTSFFVDSSFNETPMGAKWLELIDGWMTPTQQVQTGADGKFSFNGFFGAYRVSLSKDGAEYAMIMESEPDLNNNFTFQLDEIVPVNQPARNVARKRTVVIGNGAVSFSVPQSERRQLFLSAFSLSGKLLAKVPLSFSSGMSVVRKLPAGCRVYRIGTGRTTYHTSMGLNIR
jgi:GH35 family endo-1,4-beta-xylanase